MNTFIIFYQLLLPKYYDKVIMSRLPCIQAGHRQLLLDNLSGYNLLQTQITVLTQKNAQQLQRAISKLPYIANKWFSTWSVALNIVQLGLS